MGAAPLHLPLSPCAFPSSLHTAGNALLLFAGGSSIVRVVDTVQEKIIRSIVGHGSSINDLKVHPKHPVRAPAAATLSRCPPTPATDASFPHSPASTARNEPNVPPTPERTSADPLSSVCELVSHRVFPVTATTQAMVLSASQDESVRCWNIRTGVCALIFGGEEGHRNEVLSCDWHPWEPCTVVSAGMDCIIKVWEADGPFLDTFNQAIGPWPKAPGSVRRAMAKGPCKSSNQSINHSQCDHVLRRAFWFSSNLADPARFSAAAAVPDVLRPAPALQHVSLARDVRRLREVVWGLCGQQVSRLACDLLAAGRAPPPAQRIAAALSLCGALLADLCISWQCHAVWLSRAFPQAPLCVPESRN